MATFGTTPPRDPLAELPIATSDPAALLEDMWAFDCRREAQQPRAERREPISQARRDDAALPQTRFGDYP